MRMKFTAAAPTVPKEAPLIPQCLTNPYADNHQQCIEPLPPRPPIDGTCCSHNGVADLDRGTKDHATHENLEGQSSLGPTLAENAGDQLRPQDDQEHAFRPAATTAVFDNGNNKAVHRSPVQHLRFERSQRALVLRARQCRLRVDQGRSKRQRQFARWLRCFRCTIPGLIPSCEKSSEKPLLPTLRSRRRTQLV